MCPVCDRANSCLHTGEAVPSENQTVTLSQTVLLNAFPPLVPSLKTKSPDLGGQGRIDRAHQPLLAASFLHVRLGKDELQL